MKLFSSKKSAKQALKDKKAKLASNRYEAPRALVIAFLSILGAGFLIQAGFTVYSIITYGSASFGQAPQGPEYAYTIYLTFIRSNILIPILFVLAAYVVNPRGLSKLFRSFESVLIGFLGLIAWIMVGVVAQLALPQTTQPNPGFIVAFFSGIDVAVLVLFVGLLSFLRIKKYWK